MGGGGTRTSMTGVAGLVVAALLVGCGATRPAAESLTPTPAPTIVPELAAAATFWSAFGLICRGPQIDDGVQRAACEAAQLPSREPRFQLALTAAGGRLLTISATIDLNGSDIVDSPGGPDPTRMVNVLPGYFGDNLGAMPGSPPGLQAWVETHQHGGVTQLVGASVRLVAGDQHSSIDIVMP